MTFLDDGNISRNICWVSEGKKKKTGKRFSQKGRLKRKGGKKSVHETTVRWGAENPWKAQAKKSKGSSGKFTKKV